MKTSLPPSLAITLFAVVGSSLPASDSASLLLKADSISMEANGKMVAAGQAEVLTRKSVRFTADRIVIEQTAMKLEGNVLIHTANGSTIPVKELTLDRQDSRVFTLMRGRAGLEDPASRPLEFIAPSATAPDFSREFPKTETELRQRMK